MKKLRKLMCMLLALAMVFAMNVPAFASEDPASETKQLTYYGNEQLMKAYNETGEWLSRQIDQHGLIVGSTGGEWIVVGLARAGKMTKTQKDNYYKVVEDHVKTTINNQEQLHRAKSTENSRVILALTAIGKDPANVAGHNLLAGLSDMIFVKKQGINGPIWALIALDSHGYETPGSSSVTRDALIETILDGKDTNDNGWSLGGFTADPDITAMALQSLAPYQSRPAVKGAIDNGLTVLSGLQREDGGYYSWGSINMESCAQVVVALTALGIDPAQDSRFIKNGKSVLDAMLSFAVDGGGFRHTADTGVDGMATEQGYYGLVAYQRFLKKQPGLYDMSDVNDDSPVKDNNNEKDNNKKPAAATETPVGKGSPITVGGTKYKVTKASGNKREVSFTAPANKSQKNIVIPSSVTIQGKKYKVSAIAKNALKGNKTVRTVTVGDNITSIGSSAFSKCRSLKKITIGSKVKEIGKNAFSGSKKLKRIVVRSANIKKVRANALKGIQKKAVIKVPSKKLKAYRKLFRGKGQPRTVKIKK